LLDSIAIKHQQKAVMCLSTHFHEDRTGGLTFFRQLGIDTYTTAATDSISAYRGFPRAQFIMANDTSFQLGNLVMETYYPGPGHTTDNIVCWFPEQRILYGGCLIKSTVDQSLGNTSDGDLKAYASSVKRVNRKYHKAKIIIPGHHDWTDTQSIKNTLKMAKAIKKSG
jgi:glyoxylase-like metal-dependent hydrolase (beta-lactamase superfamily II)